MTPTRRSVHRGMKDRVDTSSGMEILFHSSSNSPAQTLASRWASKKAQGTHGWFYDSRIKKARAGEKNVTLARKFYFFVHISNQPRKKISAAVMRKTVLAVALLANGVPSTSKNLELSRLRQHQPQIERGWIRYSFLDHAYGAARLLKALASVCWLRAAAVCCAELCLVVA